MKKDMKVIRRVISKEIGRVISKVIRRVIVKEMKGNQYLLEQLSSVD